MRKLMFLFVLALGVTFVSCSDDSNDDYTPLKPYDNRDEFVGTWDCKEFGEVVSIYGDKKETDLINVKKTVKVSKVGENQIKIGENIYTFDDETKVGFKREEIIDKIEEVGDKFITIKGVRKEDGFLGIDYISIEVEYEGTTTDAEDKKWIVTSKVTISLKNRR